MADRRRRGSWWKIPGAIAAAFILIAGGLWVEDQFGWTDLPEEAPSAEVPSDPAYAAAGAAALERLAAMRARTGIPGATAAVSVDGELVWAGAVGWTDASTGTPVTTDTTFRIGSTSKAMTATVIARLAARDVLRLDDTVADHWPAPLNADWAQLRIDRLMSHTAGMPGYENNTDWLGLAGTLRMRKRFDSVEDGLTLVDGSRLAYAQGEDFFYSSFDTNLAARVAEAASGRDYAALLEETVTAPLGSQRPISPITATRPPSKPAVTRCAAAGRAPGVRSTSASAGPAAGSPRVRPISSSSRAPGSTRISFQAISPSASGRPCA